MSIENIIVLIKGGGEMATGIAHRLNRCHFRVCMTEISHPQAVRREVSFCEAVYDGEKTVEGLTARLVDSYDRIPDLWDTGKIPIIVDPEAKVKDFLKPAILVDAILAKKNVGTRITDAPLVIGLGPGFYAGRDVHLVIETNRGHNLGRVISKGAAEEDTGIPGVIAGFSAERVLRAPADGTLETVRQIGDPVQAGDMVGSVEGFQVQAEIKGVIRGLLRNGTSVWKGMKTGDIDPRGIKEHCYTISDKARATGGGVLEGILSSLNR
jgi:xanthine dehydrogenase accessory factor